MELDEKVVALVLTVPDAPMSPVAVFVIASVPALRLTVPVAVTAAALTLRVPPLPALSVVLPAPEIEPLTLIVPEVSVKERVLPVAADDAPKETVAGELSLMVVL